MLGLVLKIVAVVAFVLAAANQTVLNQPPADLVAWGLGFFVLGDILGGVNLGNWRNVGR